MTTLTVDIDDEKGKKALVALKAIIEAFDLNYDIDYRDELSSTDGKPYNPEFVAKIEKVVTIMKTAKALKYRLMIYGNYNPA